MFRFFSVILAFGLMLTAGAYAQSSVTGAWDLSINGPEGAITALANLKQDGEKVTGSIESPQGTAELTGTMKAIPSTSASPLRDRTGALISR